MTRRPFYPAIKAAYMAKEFGVKYLHSEMKQKMLDHNFEGVEPNDWSNPSCYMSITGKWAECKFYIDHDSMGIIKPKVGDLGMFIGDDSACAAVNRAEKGWWSEYYDISDDDANAPPVEIIKRDGKHFLSPEFEEDSDAR